MLSLPAFAAYAIRAIAVRLMSCCHFSTRYMSAVYSGTRTRHRRHADAAMPRAMPLHRYRRVCYMRPTDAPIRFADIAACALSRYTPRFARCRLSWRP